MQTKQTKQQNDLQLLGVQIQRYWDVVSKEDSDVISCRLVTGVDEVKYLTIAYKEQLLAKVAHESNEYYIYLRTATDYWAYRFVLHSFHEVATTIVVELQRYLINQLVKTK